MEDLQFCALIVGGCMILVEMMATAHAQAAELVQSAKERD